MFLASGDMIQWIWFDDLNGRLSVPRSCRGDLSITAQWLSAPDTPTGDPQMDTTSQAFLVPPEVMDAVGVAVAVVCERFGLDWSRDTTTDPLDPETEPWGTTETIATG